MSNLKDLINPMKTTGFFVSCNRTRENQAINEFHSLFSTYPEEPQENVIRFEDALLKAKTKMFKRLHIKKLKSVVIFSTDQPLDVISLFDDLKHRKISTRHINRLIPLQVICSISEIEKSIEELLEGMRFEGSYKILYESRLCESGVKQTVFETVGGMAIGKVDLDKPDWLIVVQAMMDVAGISVMKNTKFNFNGKCIKEEEVLSN